MIREVILLAKRQIMHCNHQVQRDMTTKCVGLILFYSHSFRHLLTCMLYFHSSLLCLASTLIYLFKSQKLHGTMKTAYQHLVLNTVIHQTPKKVDDTHTPNCCQNDLFRLHVCIGIIFLIGSVLFRDFLEAPV